MADFPLVQALLFSLPFVLLENRLQPNMDAQLFCDPVEVVACRDSAELNESWDKVERGLANGLHAAGFLSFELGYCVEPQLRPSLASQRNVPLLWLGLFRSVTCISQGELDARFAALGPPPPIDHLSPGITVQDYTDRVRQILEKIKAGDVYQINLTFPMAFQYAGAPAKLYAALRAAQPVANGAMIGLPDISVLSVSPELFVQVSAGQAVTRPMKGTVSRGVTEAEDAAAAAQLAADPKQRAENLMIVDLLRNDLSRVSEPGSVKVPRLFTVETFPTLHTMTSTVTAKLRQATSLRDVVQALFPCGSIVGAPKHRGMEIIRSLEDTARGIYTGGIGAVHPNGDLAFNVAIRTAVIDGEGNGRYGIGGGIVADSNPDEEWQECLLKARVLTDLAADYGLIETLRWSPVEGLCRLDLHLDRLEQSAARLNFVCRRANVQAALLDTVRALPPDSHRIRLELSRDGRAAVTSAILPPARHDVLEVIVGQIRLDAGDPFLRHKTTRRSHYEASLRAAVAAGADEAIMLNNHSDIADASQNSVFVEHDGVLLTPPLASGALAGVLRRSLLDTGQARESRLTLADLSAASRWYLGNSLRGLRSARLIIGSGRQPS